MSAINQFIEGNRVNSSTMCYLEPWTSIWRGSGYYVTILDKFLIWSSIYTNSFHELNTQKKERKKRKKRQIEHQNNILEYCVPP